MLSVTCPLWSSAIHFAHPALLHFLQLYSTSRPCLEQILSLFFLWSVFCLWWISRRLFIIKLVWMSTSLVNLRHVGQLTPLGPCWLTSIIIFRQDRQKWWRQLRALDSVINSKQMSHFTTDDSDFRPPPSAISTKTNNYKVKLHVISYSFS